MIDQINDIKININAKIRLALMMIFLIVLVKYNNFYLFLGRFHEKKGCDIVIESVNKLKNKTIKSGKIKKLIRDNFQLDIKAMVIPKINPPTLVIS